MVYNVHDPSLSANLHCLRRAVVRRASLAASLALVVRIISYSPTLQPQSAQSFINIASQGRHNFKFTLSRTRGARRTRYAASRRRKSF